VIWLRGVVRQFWKDRLAAELFGSRKTTDGRRYRKSIMITRVIPRKMALFLLILLALGLVAPQGLQADEPVVRMLLFYHEQSPYCQAILKEFLPPIQEKYGSQLEIRLLEYGHNPENYQLLEAYDAAHGVTRERIGAIEVFVGDEVLIGREIVENLEQVIEKYLAQGGVDFPPAPQVTPTPMPTYPPEAVVRVVLFYSMQCPHCLNILYEYLPRVAAKYGEHVEIAGLDIAEPRNYELLLALEHTKGVKTGREAWPAIFVGSEMFIGSRSIRNKLEPAIDQALAAGGVDFLEGLLPTKVPTATVSPSATPPVHPTATPSPERHKVYMAYFYKAGCQECSRAAADLHYLHTLYPDLEIEQFDINHDAALNEWLCQRYGVPEEKRLTAPVVFVGQDYLLAEQMTLENLRALVEKYLPTGAEPVWKDFEAEEAHQSIIARFRHFGVLTVIGAGLIDGLNPCAFATIVFFVSYLAFTGRQGRDILLVGAAFALGIFITYLLVGLGVSALLGAVEALEGVQRWVYGLTAAMCAVLAVFSFLDFLKARRGEYEEMRLRLPLRLRRWVNRVIRESARVEAFAGVALVTGFVISLIELACTGQVYLPTIIYVRSVPELQASATFYLVLYNLCFILPLVVVFTLAFFGTTSRQLGQFVNRYTAAIKLGTAVVFVGLAVWLVYALL